MQGFFQEEYSRYELVVLCIHHFFLDFIHQNCPAACLSFLFFFFKDTMTTSAPPRTSALSTRTGVKAARPAAYANATKWEWWSVVGTRLFSFPYFRRHLIIRFFDIVSCYSSTKGEECYFWAHYRNTQDVIIASLTLMKYVFVCRKNGKSWQSSGLMLYLFNNF